MVDFKKDTWIYILIAAILAIIALFTPVSSDEVAGITTQNWWSGIISYVSGGGFDDWMGGGTATLWTFGITAFSTALLLFYGLHSWRGMEFKWDWLVYVLVGIALIIFPILMLVYDAEGLTVGFAPIGVLIAGIICIIAFIFEKFGDKIFRGGA
ncbi:MAG: hypothetical protein ACFE94_10380 [Candidatus Hodarchaeota archaeon]